MSYHGDIRLADTIDIEFTTVTTTGAPTVLAGSPVISAYVGNNLTQITAGITLSVDFDGVVGLNNVRVIASGANGFATATNVTLVITTGTVGGVSVVGYRVGSFSIENRRPLTVGSLETGVDIIPVGDLGDIDAGQVVDLKFVSLLGSVATILAGSPVVSIYKDNSVTQGTTGVTLSTNFDGVVGLSNVRIDGAADPTFFSGGSNFQAVITTGTVGGVSAVGRLVGSFSIRARAALKATVAGRTADVTAAGTVGIDLGNVENPTTVLDLSGTTIKTATDVETDTQDLQARTPASLIGGRIDASIGAMTADVVTAAALAADAVAEIADAVWDEATAGHVAAGSTGLALGTAGSGASAATIADAVWDELTAGHVIAGSTGVAVAAGGSAGDPWVTPLPGAYAAGTAGKIVGDRIAASVTGAVGSVAGNVVGSVASVAGNVAGNVVGSVASVTGNVIGSVGSVIGAVGSVTGYRLSITGVDDVLRTALPEAYAADGAAATLSQLLYMLWSAVASEKSIVGTTMTTKKLDGSTTAMTFTLNSATTPTSITRAT